MKKKTHKRIKSSIRKEIWQRYGISVDFKGTLYPDHHREENHPLHPEIVLNKHHDVELNRSRIKRLIFFARNFFENGDLMNAAFDYCIALHFLCDSVILPRDCIGESKRKMLEDLFELVEINKTWNNIPEDRIDDSDVEELVDKFLDNMPLTEDQLSAEPEELIKNIMKNLYQTALKLAIFVFSE